MSLEIVPVTDAGLLPTCTPYLMPFHISYTGPAPVSRYFRPRLAPPSLTALSAQSSSAVTVVASSSSTSVMNETTPSLSTFSSTTSIGSLAHESEVRVHEPSSKTGSSIEVDNQVGQATATQLPVDTTMQTDSETQPVPGPHNASRFTRVRVSASRNVDRFVAAFRGRQMYGQAVDIPNGYGGLVLQAPFYPQKQDSMASSRPLSQKGKPKSKPRSATRRSKRGTADDTADEPQGTDDQDYSSALNDDPLPVTKKLIPHSTFTSFMLWAPDRPLDEGRDEYVRTLADWIRLAAEIHSYDE